VSHHAPDIPLDHLWTATGLIAGFQLTTFSARITRAIELKDKGKPNQLPPADYINLVSWAFILLGVFAGPISGLSHWFAGKVLGFSLTLLACYPFALAGHYELFTAGKRSETFCPFQEKVGIAVTVILGLAYIAIAYFFR
jgi:hypothetical protein